MAFISNFADQAVVLPLAVIAAIGFALMRWWRGLAAWCATVAATLGTMLLLKIGGLELALHIGWPTAISPSGHVAAGCIVYGGLAVLLLRGRLPSPLVAAAPVLVAATIGVSRIRLGAHTPAEVMVGAIVGLLGVAAMSRLAGARPHCPSWPLLAALSCTTLACHGLHIPAEQMLHQALWLR